MWIKRIEKRKNESENADTKRKIGMLPMWKKELWIKNVKKSSHLNRKKLIFFIYIIFCKSGYKQVVEK